MSIEGDSAIWKQWPFAGLEDWKVSAKSSTENSHAIQCVIIPVRLLMIGHSWYTANGIALQVRTWRGQKSTKFNQHKAPDPCSWLPAALKCPSTKKKTAKKPLAMYLSYCSQCFRLPDMTNSPPIPDSYPRPLKIQKTGPFGSSPRNWYSEKALKPPKF